jgi:hypothetical protein
MEAEFLAVSAVDHRDGNSDRKTQKLIEFDELNVSNGQSEHLY